MIGWNIVNFWVKDQKDKQCRFIFTAAFAHILSRVPILVEGTVYIYFIIIYFTYVHHAIIEHAIVMYQMKTVHSLEYFLFIYFFSFYVFIH